LTIAAVKYLLDTNTCIAAMRHHPQVVQRLSVTPPGDCAISTITAYELFTGVEKCSDPGRERPKVERLLNITCQVPFDNSAALEAARVRAALEAVGQPIGSYDFLLAGHAKSLGLVLVTHNTAEFNRVAGLTVEDWHTSGP
jgi:tRNA(fMet)-specific endonuclease VapC